MIETLEIRKIRIDAGTQSREEINEETVKEYYDFIEDEGDLPPVTVFFDGLSYYLADGYHRILAYQRAERAYIDATLKGGTLRDAVQYSLGANAEHGLPRSAADKRKAVLTCLNDDLWSELSAREIARLCKVSHTFVSEVVKQRSGVSKPKATPTKLKNVIEAPLEEVGENPDTEVATLPVNDDDAMVQEMLAENEQLKDRLAVGAMDATEEEKAMAHETIESLRAEVRNLTVELEAVKRSRDQYQTECSQLKKQITMQQRQLKKQ